MFAIILPMQKIKTEVSFVDRNGRTLSKRTSYYESGQVAEVGLYGHNLGDWSWSVPIGVIRKFYENGQLKCELAYDDQGVRDGESVFYSQYGRLVRKEIFSNDRKIKEINFEKSESA
jgi:antitoxin component YwqK of YwqJK toxin-antitoxin module